MAVLAKPNLNPPNIFCVFYFLNFDEPNTMDLGKSP